MNSTVVEPRVRPKSFTYRTTLGEVQVEGRTATLCSKGKPPLWVSSPPEFKGQKGHWTPEDFFVAAIEVCLMLTFVGLAEKRGLSFIAYDSSAEGLLEWDGPSYKFTRVVVTPIITLADEPSFVLAREIIAKAHATCLVANSIRSEVIVNPSFQRG